MKNPSKLRAWRTSLRADGKPLTLDAAGKLVGVAHSVWSQWESGTKCPSPMRAFAIETATGGDVIAEDWELVEATEQQRAARVVELRALRALHGAASVAALAPTGTGGG